MQLALAEIVREVPDGRGSTQKRTEKKGRLREVRGDQHLA